MGVSHGDQRFARVGDRECNMPRGPRENLLSLPLVRPAPSDLHLNQSDVIPVNHLEFRVSTDDSPQTSLSEQFDRTGFRVLRLLCAHRHPPYKF